MILGFMHKNVISSELVSPIQQVYKPLSFDQVFIITNISTHLMKQTSNLLAILKNNSNSAILDVMLCRTAYITIDGRLLAAITHIIL